MYTALFFTGMLGIGAPIAFVLMLSALVFILVSGNQAMLASFAQQLFGGVESYGLLALPLFMLVGELMNEGGIARRLIRSSEAMIGGVSGGLAYVNLAANVMMASILGSAAAQITVMTKVVVPEMEKSGYDKEFAVALTAAAGLLGPIIPPSMLFIIYGVIAQVSIGDMFIGGVAPGLVLSLAFLAVIWMHGRRRGFPPGRSEPMRARLRHVRSALPAAIIPLVIVGSILTGLATPTESAALAAVATLVVGLVVYRELDARQIWPALVRTAINSSIVLTLIAGAQVFGWVISVQQVPQAIAAWLLAATTDPVMFFLMVNGFLLVVGMFLDPIAALIILTPVLLPIATDSYHIDPIHFGVVICVNLTLGLLTPPVGSGLFIATALTGVKPERIARAALPFILAAAAIILLITIEPRLVTALL